MAKIWFWFQFWCCSLSSFRRGLKTYLFNQGFPKLWSTVCFFVFSMCLRPLIKPPGTMILIFDGAAEYALNECAVSQIALSHMSVWLGFYLISRSWECEPITIQEKAWRRWAKVNVNPSKVKIVLTCSKPGGYSNTPILTQLIIQVDSNQPELIRIVICVWTLPFRVDSNQLALSPTPLESRIEIGLKGIGFAIIWKIR